MQTLDERLARFHAMNEARNAGKSYTDIAAMFGLTRQRVNTILSNGEPRPVGRPRKRKKQEKA